MFKAALSVIVILATVAGWLGLAADVAAAPPRWNILFVFADDWGRYASCYRGLDGRPGLNDVVVTPAIDWLAREGVLFRNAFVSAPSCTPCRSSLFSGRLPNDFSETATKMVAAGKTFAVAKEEIVAQIRDNFRSFLAEPKSGPWLYFCGPTNTHRTWVKGSGKALWGIAPDALRGRMPAFLPDVPFEQPPFTDVETRGRVSRDSGSAK